MKHLFYFLISFLVLTSCNSDTIFDNTDKFLGTWELKTVIIEGDIVIVPPSSNKVTLNFSQRSDDFIFDGEATCNLYSGDIRRVTNQTIIFGELATTEIFCNDQLNSFEAGYYSWLKSSTQYIIEGNNLTLLFDNNGKLIYEKE